MTILVGSQSRTRTCNLAINSRLLCQLSYLGMREATQHYHPLLIAIAGQTKPEDVALHHFLEPHDDIVRSVLSCLGE